MLALHQVGSEEPKPHLPIRLKLNEKPRQYRERVLKKVKTFPLFHPIGPIRRPAELDTNSATQDLHGQARIDALHTLVIDGIENELIDLYDIPEVERELFKGRGRAPKFVWRHAGGAPSGKAVASNRTARTWRLLQKRLEDILWALDSGDAFRFHRTLVEAAKDLEDVQHGAGQLVEMWRYRVGIGDGVLVYGEIRNLTSHCGNCAEREEQEFSRTRIQGFRDWARAAVKAGGGAAHAYAKVPKHWRAALVPGGPHPGGQVGQSSNPQLVVDAELDKWISGPWNSSNETPADLPP